MTGPCALIRWADGVPCGHRAAWVVSVGSRKSDAQLSCARHLHRTCEALLGAENRAGASLTVTSVKAAEFSLLRSA